MDEAAPHLGTWEIGLALDVAGRNVIGAGSIRTALLAGGTRFAEVEVSGTVASDGLATVRLVPMDEAVLAGSVTLKGSSASRSPRCSAPSPERRHRGSRARSPARRR